MTSAPAMPGSSAPDSSTPDKDQFVQSLATGIRVLESFSDTHPRMTLAEVARRTDVSRATARRMLHTLVHLGYAHTDGRQFSLTPRVLGLGHGYWSSAGLTELLQPILRDLGEALGESCSASVLVGEEIMYISRVHTRRIMRMDLGVGTRLPAFATSMGRVLLSDVDEATLVQRLQQVDRPAYTTRTTTDPQALAEAIGRARVEGHAMVDQELEDGLRSIAVPIHHPERGIIAAINASAAAGAESAEQTLKRLLPRLREGARGAERMLVAWEKGTQESLKL